MSQRVRQVWQAILNPFTFMTLLDPFNFYLLSQIFQWMRRLLSADRGAYVFWTEPSPILGYQRIKIFPKTFTETCCIAV